MARALRALAAVLVGNALYFVVISPRAPAWSRHEPFRVDLGLLLDFLLCVAIYLALGRLGRRGRHAG